MFVLESSSVNVSRSEPSSESSLLARVSAREALIAAATKIDINDKIKKKLKYIYPFEHPHPFPECSPTSFSFSEVPWPVNQD